MREEDAVTVRESIHLLVDALPDEQMEEVRDYLAELNDSGEVGHETKTAIEEGLDDLHHGRAITLDEYKRTRRL